MITIRQVIKARDIQNFFGKKERQSFKMMGEMRNHFAKKPYQPITISDFCEYYKVQAAELLFAMQATDELENQNAAKQKNKNNLPVQNSPSSLDSEGAQNLKYDTAKPYRFS